MRCQQYFSYILNTNFQHSIPYTSLHHTKFISHKVPIHISHIFFLIYPTNYLDILPHTSYKLHISQSTYTHSSYILQIHFSTNYLQILLVHITNTISHKIYFLLSPYFPKYTEHSPNSKLQKPFPKKAQRFHFKALLIEGIDF